MRQLKTTKTNNGIRIKCLKDIQRKIKYLSHLHSTICHDSGDNFWSDSFMDVQLSYGKIIVMSADMEFIFDPYWSLTKDLPYFGDFNNYSTYDLRGIAYILNTVDDDICKTFRHQDVEFLDFNQMVYASAFKVARKALYRGVKYQVNFGKYTTSKFTVKNGVATYEILNNYAEPLLSVKNGVIDLRKSALINRKRGIHVFNPIVVNLINARLVEDAMRF